MSDIMGLDGDQMNQSGGIIDFLFYFIYLPNFYK